MRILGWIIFIILFINFIWQTALIGYMAGSQSGYCKALESKYAGFGCIKGNEIIYRFN